MYTIRNNITTTRYIERNSSIDKMQWVIAFLFAVMPLVDSVNGFLIKGGTESLLSIGILYRLLIVVVLGIASIYACSKTTILFISLFIGYMLIAILIHSLTNLSSGNITTEIRDALQWAYCPMVTLMLVDMKRGKLVSKNFVEKTIPVMSWIMVATILLPFAAGLGYSTYASSEGLVGYKAFYYATNGVTLLAIVTFSFSLMRLILTKNKSNIILLILSGACLLLIGTKSSLLMLLVSVALVFYAAEKGRVMQTLKRAIPLLIIMVVILVLAIRYNPEFFNPIINRTVYFFNTSDSFASFITSGRVDRVPLIFDRMTSNDSIIPILFGIGSYSSLFNWCEMDFLDIFFEFGVLGLAMLLAFSIWSIKVILKNGVSYFSLISLFILIYAAVVGHVFTNSMSSMVFSLCILGSTISNRSHSLEDQ